MALTTPPGFRLLFWRGRTHLIRATTPGPPFDTVCALENTVSAYVLDAAAEVERPCHRCAAIVKHEATPWVWTP